MRRAPQKLTLLVLLGLGFALAACAQLKALPTLPATHPEEVVAGPVSCSECHEDQQKGTMKPYTAFNHTRAFIAGVTGVPVTGTAVVVNIFGQLGVAPSSQRF